MLKGGRRRICGEHTDGNPAASASVPSRAAADYLGTKGEGGQDSVQKRTHGNQRRVRRPPTAQPHPPISEVVQCAATGCERTLERPVKPRGRPRLYCSQSCRHFEWRNRVRGSHPVLVSGRELLAKYREQEAQRRAAPEPTFNDALTALRGVPELQELLRGTTPQAVNYAHGHEASHALPPRPRAHPAHPAETQQQPTPNRTRPLGERKRK